MSAEIDRIRREVRAIAEAPTLINPDAATRTLARAVDALAYLHDQTATVHAGTATVEIGVAEVEGGVVLMAIGDRLHRVRIGESVTVTL